MKKFVKATLIITVFSVATRALGFVLRIVLSRLMGAETLGAYQISMSIFGVLMTVIASGLPLIVSRNVSYYQDKDVKKQNRIISAGTTIGLEKRELLNYSVGAILLVVCVVVLPQYVGGISILIGIGVMHIMSAILSLVELKRRNLINWSFNKYFAICGLILVPTALL